MKFERLIADRPTKKIYKDGNFAVKIFDKMYSKSDVLNEALNHARVEETGLPIPKIIEVKKYDDNWAIVSEYADGKTLAQLIDENPDKVDEYLEYFVDLQLTVQSKHAPLLNKLKDKMTRKINESSVDATTRYELHTRLQAMPKHKKVCHGDFNPSNVVIDSNNNVKILDWAHATQGNAGADAARTYMLFKLAKNDELAEKYIKLFCLKSDTARQYINQWLPIVAASQLVKGNENEKELLLTWTDIADYD